MSDADTRVVDRSDLIAASTGVAKEARVEARHDAVSRLTIL